METPISGLPEIGNQKRAGAGCGTRAHRQHDLAGLGLIAHTAEFDCETLIRPSPHGKAVAVI
jgi:hypothetical protein